MTISCTAKRFARKIFTAIAAGLLLLVALAAFSYAWTRLWAQLPIYGRFVGKVAFTAILVLGWLVTLVSLIRDTWRESKRECEENRS